MTTNGPQPTLRRLGIALLLLLCVAALPTGASAAPAGVSAAPPASAYDHTVGAADCALLGREYVPGSGCSRTHCVPGATLFRKTYGAEACALRHQPKGYGFVATVDNRTCTALGRRWMPEVNYCASDPDRSITAVYDAPQCRAPATVYVNLTETDGYFDECLTAARADELTDLAGSEGRTLAQEVADHSAVQCPTRPGHVFVNGLCVVDTSFTPAGGGTVMIGDSLTWRGTDELARLRPSFTIDGEPARPPTELAPRLAAYRAAHGQPSGLIIELGTVPARSFTKKSLQKIVDSLPASTKVMLVQPYYVLRYAPVATTPQSRAVDAWMAEIARSRKNTCVADWPAFAGARRGILADGVHLKHAKEGVWAHWISDRWGHC